uniref:ABI3-like factor n=1 Tax=Pisum sativum TaxID=3888 RepID=B4XEV5_PEA|nr:ABI3-like factor [Pisum sativum]
MECVLDLHAKMVNEREEDGFGSLGEDEKLVAVSEREIWLDDATNHQDDDDLLASWAVLKSEVEEDHHHGEKMKSCDNNHGFLNMHDPLDHHHHHGQHATTASIEIPQQQQELGVGDCMEDVMMDDTFGYMELLEANDFFDPASIFQTEGETPLVDDFTQEQEQVLVQHQQVPIVVHDDSETKLDLNFDGVGVNDGACDGVNDEMSNVFLEWLKSNKDSVSANDLRNVKLKKSTIESAARRLGGGKEGMKQLLKLILEWVQTSHLQNKRLKENNNNTTTSNVVPQQPLPQFQDLCPNQNTTNTCFNQTSWMDQTQTPLVVPPQQFSQGMVGVGYVGDIHYTNGSVSNSLYQQGSTNEYHQFNVVPNYNQPSFVDSNNNVVQPHGLSFGGYGNQYGSYQFFHGGGGDRLMRLGPSATKEARKKRMARQRRFVSHHRNHHQGSESVARLGGGGGGDNCTNGVGVGSHANQANWMYWQSMAGGKAASLAPVVRDEQTQPPVERDRTNNQTQNSHQGRNASDKKQGWKPEKNLKFLLQKVLKQSDVGSLGRIVLPKKEAETHLPELEARDGISITMEDIGTSRVWNMRYRYWPNNKSRMYLLENTGDFVKANGLQEGDFIVLYSDVKCGKFMIRGVKVRQQGAKPEAKKTGKAQKNQQQQQHGNNNSNTAGNDAVDNNDTPSSPKRKK